MDSCQDRAFMHNIKKQLDAFVKMRTKRQDKNESTVESKCLVHRHARLVGKFEVDFSQTMVSIPKQTPCIPMNIVLISVLGVSFGTLEHARPGQRAKRDFSLVSSRKHKYLMLHLTSCCCFSMRVSSAFCLGTNCSPYFSVFKTHGMGNRVQGLSDYAILSDCGGRLASKLAM
jgi:hypothetical protein